MVCPWQFEQDPALVPLRAAAEALATRTDRRDLYDLDRLSAKEVPVVAAVHHDDMYVHREHAPAPPVPYAGCAAPGSPSPLPTTASGPTPPCWTV